MKGKGFENELKEAIRKTIRDKYNKKGKKFYNPDTYNHYFKILEIIELSELEKIETPEYKETKRKLELDILYLKNWYKKNQPTNFESKEKQLNLPSKMTNKEMEASEDTDINETLGVSELKEEFEKTTNKDSEDIKKDIKEHTKGYTKGYTKSIKKLLKVSAEHHKKLKALAKSNNLSIISMLEIMIDYCTDKDLKIKPSYEVLD